MNRQELQQQLKQLRREGYVTDGFKLVSSTTDLSQEYHQAIAKKQAHEAKLMQDAYECEVAFYTRQEAQAELDQHLEDQPLGEYSDVLEGWEGCCSDVLDRSSCAVGYREKLTSEDMYQRSMAIEYQRCIPSMEASFWYNTMSGKMEQVETWQESRVLTELTCDVLGSWYSIRCHVDPDCSYNYDRTDGIVKRVIKDDLPPTSELNLLRKLRVSV